MLRGRLAVLWLLTCAGLASAGCGDDRVAELLPHLSASASSVADPTGAADLVVDFGQVAVGATGSATFGLLNDGRAPLTLATLAVDAPFGLDGSAAGVLAPGQEGLVVATFAPTVTGPAESVIEVASDGGSLKVRLTGTGRRAGASECVYGLSAAALDFGVVGPGGQRDLSLRFVNKGAAACVLRGLGLEAGSDASFSLVGGAVAEQTVPAFADASWKLRFAPAVTGDRFAGTLGATVDGAAPLRVALSASAVAPATAKVYLNGPTTLSTWDPGTRNVAPVGTFKAAPGVSSVGKMTDTAIDGAGVLYGCSVDGSNRLFRIDAATALVVSSLPMEGSAQGLTVLPTGELVASGDGVWVVDPSTGRKLRTIVPGGRYQTSGDIIALPDGTLAWTVKEQGQQNDVLVRIEQPTQATPVVVRVGALSGRNQVYGLGFADGVLYGFTKGGTSFDVDPARASSGGVTSAPGEWWGATTNPTRW